MAYKALYRSYRPTKFSEVIGQEHVIQTLQNAIKENRTSHAYMFSGLRGIGKTTIARILAKAVNCENPINGEPCNECQSCKAINESLTSDIVELDAASNNGVEEMRNILDKVNFLPAQLKKKVYIIDEVHMLTTSAFNALLKTLEEPPAYVMFIMATTEPHKVPLTILSRCQRFDFKQLTLEELIKQIKGVAKKEKISIDDDATSAIAEVADGGMRDALSILDQAATYAKDKITLEDINNITGNVNTSELIKLVTSFNNKDAGTALDVCTNLLNNGKEATRMITCVIEFCRDLLLYKSLNEIPSDKSIFKNEEFVLLADNTKESNLFYYIDVLNDTQNKLRYTNSQKIYLEVGLMRIINQTDKDIDILSRIKALEEGTPNVSNGDIVDNSSLYAELDSKVKKLYYDFQSLQKNNTQEDTLKRLGNIEIALNNLKSSQVVAENSEVEDKLIERIEFIETSLAATSGNIDSNELKDIEEKINQLVKQLDLVSNDSVNHSELDKVVDSLSKSIEDVKSSIDNIDLSNIDVNNLPKNHIDTPSNNVKEIEELYKILDGLAIKVESITSGSINNEDILKNIDLSEITNRLDSLESAVNDKEQTNLVSNNSNTDEIDEIRSELALLRQIIVTRSELDQVLKEIESLNDKVIDLQNKPQTVIKEKIVEQIVEKPLFKEEIKEEPIKVKEEPFVITEETEETKEEPPVIEENDLSKTNLFDVEVENFGPQKRRNPFETPAPPAIPANEDEEDITAKVYDAKILSRTLNEARNPECSRKRDLIMAGWSKLTDKVGGVLSAPASILANSTFRAVGISTLIITLPTAELCNTIMEPNNHKLGKEVFKLTFNEEYDYLAIPDKTWVEKREEYTSRIANGELYPTLNPFKNPSLRIVIPKEKEDINLDTSRKMNDFFSNNN